MSILQCPHPECDKPLGRGKSCCGRHWHQLSKDLQHRLGKAYYASKTERDALRREVIEYFESRKIGDHEILKCRGKDCDQDIVILVTQTGDKRATNAEDVQAEDSLFDFDRHIAHTPLCPNSSDFRGKW